MSWLQLQRRDGTEYIQAPDLCRNEPNTCINTDTSEVCTTLNKVFLLTIYSQTYSSTACWFGWHRQTVTGSQPTVHVFFEKILPESQDLAPC